MVTAVPPQRADQRRRRQLRWIWIVTIAAGGAYTALDAAVFTLVGDAAIRITTRLALVWTVLLACAAAASWKFDRLFGLLRETETAREQARVQIEQLEAQNDLLETLARSRDVALAFHALARRIAALVPCDRVGLALIKEGGQGFQTFTARVGEAERRTRPRPEVEFDLEGTVLGRVVRSREPLVVDDLGKIVSDYLDANVLYSAGFQSGVIVPLLSKGRAVGTLNVVSRSRHAFTHVHASRLLPIAELLAVGWVAQHLQSALDKYRATEAMTGLALSVSNEITSAVQTIVGHCDLLERGYPDPALQQDLAMVVRQAQRIVDLLDRLKHTARERLQTVAAAVADGGIPKSPEGFLDQMDR